MCVCERAFIHERSSVCNKIGSLIASNCHYCWLKSNPERTNNQEQRMQLSQAPEGLSGHRHAQDSNTPVHGIKSLQLCVYILIRDRQEKQEKSNPHKASETVTNLESRRNQISHSNAWLLLAEYIYSSNLPANNLLRTSIIRNCASACFAFPRLPCYSFLPLCHLSL